MCLPHPEFNILWGRESIWPMPSPGLFSAPIRIRVLARGLAVLLA